MLSTTSILWEVVVPCGNMGCLMRVVFDIAAQQLSRTMCMVGPCIPEQESR